MDASDTSLGTVDFKLADYTVTEELVTDWTFIDLTSLGTNVSKLAFSLSSTDNGPWGMNTPSYFAMDNLTVAAVPEPATITLLALTAAGLFGVRRFRT